MKSIQIDIEDCALLGEVTLHVWYSYTPYMPANEEEPAIEEDVEITSIKIEKNKQLYEVVIPLDNQALDMIKNEIKEIENDR